MKKIFLLLILAIFSIGRAISQITAHTYQFESFTRPYTALTGATNVPGSFLGDDQYTTVPIGFPFPFCNNNYTSCVVSSNGWISFNTGIANSYFSNSWANAQALKPGIMFYWDDMTCTGSQVRYLTSGVAPNRVFVIEFFDWRRLSANGAMFDVQVLLHENGTIETHFSDKPGTYGFTTASLGIIDQNNLYQSLQNVSANPPRSTTVFEENISAKPQNLQVYKWYFGTLNEAGVNALLRPGGAFCTSTRELAVQVKNFGDNDITELDVNWSVNGNTRTPVRYTQTIEGAWTSTNNTAEVVLGNLTFNPGDTFRIKTWTSNPNNALDPDNTNDTLSFTLFATSTIPVNLGPDTLICDNAELVLGRDNSPNYRYNWSNGLTSTAITVNTAGMYAVKKSDNLGCFGVDTIYVTTKPAPSVDLGSDVEICTGDTVILDVGAANYVNTILWEDNSSNSPRIITQGGTYSVTVTAANGCSDRDEVAVIYKDLPSFDDVNAIYVLKGSYNFNIRNPRNFTKVEWDYGDQSAVTEGNQTSHTYLRNGRYTITVKLYSVCNDSFVTYSETIDVFDAEPSVITDVFTTQLKVYPVPASASMTIETTEHKFNRMVLTNSIGQLVAERDVELTNNYILDVASVPDGIYQLAIYGHSGLLSVIKVQILR